MSNVDDERINVENRQAMHEFEQGYSRGYDDARANTLPADKDPAFANTVTPSYAQGYSDGYMHGSGIMLF